MPAEMLNQLEATIPIIKVSVTDNRTGPSTRADPRESLKAEMRAMKFILNLPIVELDFLLDDEKYCSLCSGKYDVVFRVTGRRESPCCLPCGHIAGHQCLRAHLSPYESGFTECPFCHVDFPQMFTDPVEPARPTRDVVPGADAADDHGMERSRQVAQLSRDAGAPSGEVQRYLSIDEVLERSRGQMEGLDLETEVRDFATRATDAAEVGEEEFPKNRKNGASPALARAATKAVDMVSRNF